MLSARVACQMFRRAAVLEARRVCKAEAKAARRREAEIAESRRRRKAKVKAGRRREAEAATARAAAERTAAERATVEHAAAERATVEHAAAERAAAEHVGVVAAIAALEWRVAAEESAAFAALAAIFEEGSEDGRRALPSAGCGAWAARRLVECGRRLHGCAGAAVPRWRVQGLASEGQEATAHALAR